MPAPHRTTKQRTAILEALKERTDHPTADQLYACLKPALPHLSLGTVYRNLNVLIEMGQAKRLEYGSTFDRFEATIEPHAHLICRECGVIRDYPASPIPDSFRQAEKETGFRITSCRVDYYGTCKDCLSK